MYSKQGCRLVIPPKKLIFGRFWMAGLLTGKWRQQVAFIATLALVCLLVVKALDYESATAQTSTKDVCPNRFDKTECTWLAAEMRPDLRCFTWDYPTERKGHEWNAYRWKENFENLYKDRKSPYLVDQAPEVGSIVVWNKGPEHPLGHVGYLTGLQYTDDLQTNESRVIGILVTHQYVNAEGNLVEEVDKDFGLTMDMSFIHTIGYSRAKSANQSPPPFIDHLVELPIVVKNHFPLQSFTVETESEFELWLDGELVLSGSRPPSYRVYPKDRIWLWPGTHNGMLKYWRARDATGRQDREAIFRATWWPGAASLVRAEEGPTAVPAGYTYAFAPPSAIVGQVVEITVGAAEPSGTQPIDFIDVFVNGARLGGAPSIRGRSGLVRWDTTGQSAGNYQISFQGHIQGYDGAVEARNVTYRLNTSAGAATQLGAPRLVGPANGAGIPKSANVTLAWTALAGASEYQVEVWGGPYDRRILCDWQFRTTCLATASQTGTMSWRVKARDSGKREGVWSETWSFAIEEAVAALGRPSLSSPGNGAQLAQSTDVTLAWNGVSGATQYKVELWGDPYSTMTPCNWQTGTSCHIGQMWPGTMSWKVKARDGSGRESDWSDTWSFTIREATATPVPALGRPSLSSPGNGAQLAQSTDVTLVWNGVSGATQYKVELWGGPYSTMTPCNWQNGTSCHIGQMWPGTMSWKVKARDSSGRESEWSDTWSFTIREATATPVPALGRPSLSSPGNGAQLAQSTDVTLAWSGVSGATQYKVELWGGPYSTMTPCNWQNGTSCHIGQMWPGTMSWKVKARDASGRESDWSDTRSFTIQQQQSSWKPSLASPQNGARLSRDTQVTLSWNSLSGATQYKVELWGGPYSTMTPCNWQNGTSCRIGQMWPGTMSWKVKARDSSGRESEWSDTWSFTVAN